MSKLLAVTAREVRERWLFLPTGLVLGFMPLVLQPAFALQGEDARFLCAFEVMVLVVAAAVVAGSTMLARDAADGRLGFLFSRPVSWPTVWGAKWLGAVSLACGAGLATAVALLVAGRLSWRDAFEPSDRLVALGVSIVLGIGVANFCATAFRSRSSWVVADLLLAPTALWLARRWGLPVLFGLGGSSWHAATWAAPTSVWFPGWRLLLFVAPLLVGLVVASAFQVAVGRTDLRRAHRAMSLAFWAIVFLALGLAGLRLAWARAARPIDIAVGAAAGDPAGRWVYAWGASRRGGWATFLIDSETGRYLSLGPGQDARALKFSRDGRLAARLRQDGEDETSVLDVVDLGAPVPRVFRVPLESSPPPTWRTALALSPSGGTALLVHESGASLFDTASGRRVATTTLAPGWQAAATRFLAEDRARVWLGTSAERASAASRAEMRVLDLDLDGSTSTSTFELGTAPDPARSPLVAADAEGRRLLTNDGGLHLRDGETGALLATLAEGSASVSAAFLADGRVVVAEGVAAQTELRVFDRNGVAVGEATLGIASTGLRVGPEVAPGRVAVAFARSFAVGETLVVDVAGPEVTDRLAGLLPALPPVWPGGGPSARGGIARAHFFQDAQGRLVRIDFATGERKVVAGPGAPAGERIAGP